MSRDVSKLSVKAGPLGMLMCPLHLLVDCPYHRKSLLPWFLKTAQRSCEADEAEYRQVQKDFQCVAEKRYQRPEVDITTLGARRQMKSEPYIEACGDECYLRRKKIANDLDGLVGLA